MSNQPRTGSRRRKPRKGSAQPDLWYLVALGASARRPDYMRFVKAFLIPVLITIFVQSSIYAGMFSRANRSDWDNAGLTIAALVAVPVFSAFLLIAFQRNRAPISTAVVVVLVFFSFVVTALSALRIPVSYSGLVFTLPATMLTMSLAYVWFVRASDQRVGLVKFSGHKAVRRQLGDQVSLINDPAADLAALDIVLIDPGAHHDTEWSAFLSRCYLSGVEIMPWTRFVEIRLGLVDIASFELAHLSYSPSQILYAYSKRFLDLLAVLVSLPIVVPLAALVALYLFAIDRGPVIFVQIRRGFGGGRFRMYKFRTMYRDVRGGSTVDGDARIMPGCGLIRKLRLDELPQLYNILRGEMSLVGPRPVAERVFRSSEKVEPKYALRGLVSPGITGWAQVSMGYASTTAEEIEKLAFDLYYVKNLSFDLDLQILFKTARTVLFGTGAK